MVCHTSSQKRWVLLHILIVFIFVKPIKFHVTWGIGNSKHYEYESESESENNSIFYADILPAGKQCYTGPYPPSIPFIGNTFACKLHLFGHNCGSPIVMKIGRNIFSVLDAVSENWLTPSPSSNEVFIEYALFLAGQSSNKDIEDWGHPRSQNLYRVCTDLAMNVHTLRKWNSPIRMHCAWNMQSQVFVVLPKEGTSECPKKAWLLLVWQLQRSEDLFLYYVAKL